MEELYNILQAIKKEPYRIGKRSIFHLEAFFLGYDYAHKTQSPSYKKYKQEFRELIQWIRNKYDAGKSCAWSSVILFYSEDEKDALDNFFKLFDEFLNENRLEKYENDSKSLE